MPEDRYKKSIEKIRKENPDVSNINIKPAGFLGKLFNRRANAITNPFTGSVEYYPDRMNQLSEDEVDNIFTHELQHTRQVQQTPMLQRLFSPFRMYSGEEQYSERPRELEAFQAEKDRNLRMGLGTPNPLTGARDIQLPAMSKRRAIIDNFSQERKIRGLE